MRDQLFLLLCFLFLNFPLHVVIGQQPQGNSTPLAREEKVPEEKKGHSHSVNKWYAVNQTALLLGSRGEDAEKNALSSPSLKLSGGYIIKNGLQAGLGVGYGTYGGIVVFPVFAEIRGNILNTPVSPFYALKGGGAFAGVQDNRRYQHARGGAMMELQGGLSIKLGCWSWLIGGGYYMQKIKLEGEQSWGWGGAATTYTQNRTFRRLSASSSFRFTF